jgi:excisionase family DNA binding protein
MKGGLEMSEKSFLTPKEAAVVLRIPLRRVWKLIREGKLPVIEVGPRTRRIPTEALVQLSLGQKQE